MSLRMPSIFFDRIRGPLFDHHLAVSEVKGINYILAAGNDEPLAYLSYELATAFHETGGAMVPIEEHGSDAYLDKYDTGRLAAVLGNTPENDDDGIRLAGKGLVQITGARNYKFATKRLHELGVLLPDEDMFKDPALALRQDVASACLVHGMREGWFTGKKLSSYLPASGMGNLHQFTEARRIINRLDRAENVAHYALLFQTALVFGGHK